jgi:hypothetical protein
MVLCQLLHAVHDALLKVVQAFAALQVEMEVAFLM